MKKIEAYFRPEKTGAVRKAVEELDITGLNICQVDGHGKQRGAVQRFNGHEYTVGIFPKTKLEIVVKDSDVKTVVDAIVAGARTGKCGDGKIFISDVTEVVRIRTGEMGETGL